MKYWLMLMATIPVCLNAQTRLTQDEALQASDVSCTPDRNGLLECTALPVPPPLLGNDPSIKPWPNITYSPEHYSAVTIRRPNPPEFDPIPPVLSSDSLVIAWDLNYGIPVQYWEIWDNGQLRYRGQQFAQRPITPKSGLEGPIYSVRILSMQSGYYRLTSLSPGRHELNINLCSMDEQEGPLCVKHNFSTWVGEEKNKALPGKPQLDWLPSAISGEPLEVRWNIWWGTLGQYWQLFDNEVLLFESRAFQSSDRAVQAGGIRIDSPSPGAHMFQVRLCNVDLCTSSDSALVNVVLPAEQNPAVILQARRTDRGEWLLRWRLPYAFGTQMPDRWQLLDGAGQVLWEKQTVSQCPAISNENQAAVFAAYCGDALLPANATLTSAMVRVCAESLCYDSPAISLDIEPLDPLHTPTTPSPQ